MDKIVYRYIEIIPKNYQQIFIYEMYELGTFPIWSSYIK